MTRLAMAADWKGRVSWVKWINETKDRKHEAGQSRWRVQRARPWLIFQVRDPRLRWVCPSVCLPSKPSCRWNGMTIRLASSYVDLNSPAILSSLPMIKSAARSRVLPARYTIKLTFLPAPVVPSRVLIKPATSIQIYHLSALSALFGPEWSRSKVEVSIEWRSGVLFAFRHSICTFHLHSTLIYHARLSAIHGGFRVLIWRHLCCVK